MNKNIKKGLLLLLFIVLGIIAIFPIYYLLISSFRPSEKMFRSGIVLFVKLEEITLRNYRYLFSESGKIYFYWYRNSILITAIFTTGALFLTSFVGYGLAVYNFKGRNLILTAVLFIMMIPLEILMLPLYKLLIAMKLMNTYQGVILPFVVSPIGIFFFRQYATGIQKDYIDAGRIDGCTEYGIFFKIIAPLMKPAYSAMAILLSMRSWNDFVWPLIVLRTNKMFTIPIGLAGLLTPYGNNYDLLLSGAILAIIPVIIVFIFNQKYFVSGITIGGIKG